MACNHNEIDVMRYIDGEMNTTRNIIFKGGDRFHENRRFTGSRMGKILE